MHIKKYYQSNRNNMLAQYSRNQYLTQAIWLPRVVKKWTLGPGPVQFTVEVVPATPHNGEKKEHKKYIRIV